MRLHATQVGFYLNVIDYDEPHDGATYGQRNRLLTNLRLMDNGRQWETFGALFYTDELRKLLDWLTDLLANHETNHQLTFREPDVRIEVSDDVTKKDQFRFQFMLCYGAAPPWWTGDPGRPYPITIECSRSVIKAAVVDLTLQIRAFPTR